MQPIPLIAVHAVMILMLSSNRHAPAFPQGTQMCGMPSPPDTIVLTLREAGRLALEREPGLQADRQGAAIARGEYRQSRLDGLNPAIDFQQYETGALGGTQAYTVGLSLELPWAGQRGLRIAAARAGMERANATTADAVRLAEATVSLAFFGAVAAERRLQLAEQMAAASQRFFDLTRIQLREGEISALEANLTDIEFGRSRARLLAARRDATAALLELRRLIGVSSVTPIRLVDAAWSAPTAVPLNEDSLIAVALATRPDLEAGRRQLAQSASLRRLAAREAIPTPRLSAFNQRDAGEQASRFGLGISVLLPVVDRAQGRVDQEEARVAQARSRVAALELAVGAEVAEAYRTLQAATEEVSTLESLVLGPARRNLALVDSAYQAGKLALPTVLLIRNQLLDAELDFWRAWQVHREALVRLHLATATPITPVPSSRAPSAEDNR